MRKTKRQVDWSAFSSIVSAQATCTLFLRLVLILAIPILLGSLLQACGGSGGGPPLSNVQSVTIDPVSPSVAHGTQIQLHATANFKNKRTKDVTTSATWVSGNSAIANVSNSHPTKGLSSGAGVGATTVSAKFQGKTGTSPFTVTNATLKSITVVPVNPVTAKGTTVQLAAEGTFSNGNVQDLTNQVTWSSGNSGIATVSTAPGTQGLVTGVSVGNTPITATLNGIAGSTTVTVSAATVKSITITPPVATIAKGTTLQLHATCNLSDGTTENCTNDATWASSGVATVSDTSPTKGLVTGATVGTATITASFNGLQGSATITVTSATLVTITVLPDPSIANGTTVQLTATGEFSDKTTENLTTQVSWTSGNNAIAEVSNAAGSQGLVTGLSVGSTPITAKAPQTLGSVQGSTTVTVDNATVTSITITPPDSSIAKGTTALLFATCDFSDATTEDCTNQVSWSSANNAIAPVSDAPGTKGLVTGVSAGAATITAELDGVEGSTAVAVTPATIVSIAVTPADPSVTVRGTQQLVATATLTDKNTQNITSLASWIPSDPTIATVGTSGTQNGLVTGLKQGTATITATLAGISGLTTVTVVPTPEFAYVTDSLGFVSVFSVDTATGVLTPVQLAVATGLSPVAVTADPSGRFLYVVNQGGNSVSTYTIAPTGTLTAGPTVPTGGTSPVGIAVVPSGNFAYVVDSGTLDISGFKINPDGTLTSIGPPVFVGGVKFVAPQPVAANPNAEFIYVSNRSGNVLSFTFSSSTGALSAPSLFPALPPALPFAITLDPKGEHLFALGLGAFPAAPVSPFTVDAQSGALAAGPNEGVMSGPDSLAVDPDSAFVYVVGVNPGSAPLTQIRSLAIEGNTLVPRSGPELAGTRPSAVAVDPSNHFVYVTDNGAGGSGVLAYKIMDGVLTAPTTGSIARPQPLAITVIAVP
jgi:6-phosphogluconolactonase (cycloisomerase 2 family)